MATIDGISIGFWDILTLLLVFFFLYAVLYPQSQLKKIRMLRQARLKKMEKTRGCKVLTMIHRREAISMFGLPAYQFIDEEDAEQILRGIRKFRDRPLELLLHTSGGQLHASIQIARALKNHPQKTRVIIPHYSMSGGTMIALAADEIVMDKNAVLGPIDPQVGDFIRGIYPAASWIHIEEMKKERAGDFTLLMSDISRKSLELTRKVAFELLKGKFGPDKKNEIVEKLVSGEMIHITPLSAEEAKALGLNVNTDFPEDVHEFMRLFRPVKSSVEFVE
ncbi:MAG: hypothetical protein PHW56_10235 [Methanosarcinaceae archaeon]|nr:hypothetical protein [Methanosarcinaceae archaeon]